jgi:hypothetical protein
MDFTSTQLLGVVNGLDLNSLIQGVNPLYNATTTGWFGETYGFDGFIDGLSLTANYVNLDLNSNGNVELVGNATNTHIQLRLRSHNGFLPTITINIGATASPIDFNSNINLSAQNHLPVINLAGLDLNIGNVSLDGVSGIFAVLIDPIVTAIVGLFDGLIADAIEGAISSKLPDLFDDLIQDNYELMVNGRTMQMYLQLETLTTANDSLLMAMSGGVVPIDLNPAIPQPLGPIYTADALPEPVSGSGDFAVAVNTNVINQTLVSAFSIGAIHMNIVEEQIHYGLPWNYELGAEGAS